MNILSRLRLATPKETGFAGAVSLHFHRRREGVVVATLARTSDGVCFSVPEGAVLLPWPTHEALGDAFRQAFSRFAMRDADLTKLKRTDAPAYKASGCRSVSEFERTYVAVYAQSVNDANIVVRACAQHPRFEQIELSTCFNPRLPSATIGKHLLDLLDAVLQCASDEIAT